MDSKASTRRFEYKDDKSSKFWEISVTGEGFTVRYGKIGTDGQTQAKEYADAATAEKQAQKLIAGKVGKGYMEVSNNQTEPNATLNVANESLNELDPLPIRERINNPDASYKRDLEKLLQYSDSLDDDNLKIAIETYANYSRLFCVPRLLRFDRNNPLHRISDQIFCGFPFTSSTWPWPKGASGNFMQPIAQINLKNAGGFLEADIGDGLLQVWGEVDGNENMETRVIPIEDLGEPLDSFYPDKSPWLHKSLSFEGCVVQSMAMEEEDVQSFSPEYCRVEWMRAGQMFYASVSMCLAENNDEVYNLIEDQSLLFDLDDLPEKMSLPGANNLVSIFGKKPIAHLGGYPEEIGNIWANFSDPRRMLLYHSYDQWMCIGVTFEVLQDNKIEYVALTAR